MCCLADLLRLLPELSTVTWTEYYNDTLVNNSTLSECTIEFLLDTPDYKDKVSKELCYFTRIDIQPCVNYCRVFIRYDTYGDDK